MSSTIFIALGEKNLPQVPRHSFGPLNHLRPSEQIDFLEGPFLQDQVSP